MDHTRLTNSTVYDMNMVPVGSVSSVPTSVQPLKPNEHMRFPELMVHYGGRPQIGSTSSSAMNTIPCHSGFQHLAVPNNELREAGAMFSSTRPQQSQIHVKRKSPMENLSGYPLSPRVAMPNMKVGQLEHRPWLTTSLPYMGNAQHHMQSGTGHFASQQVFSQNKRTIQLQAGPPKSGSQKSSTSRGHPTQGKPSPRAQNELNEPVRSKLRESIRAALALVTVMNEPATQEVTSDSIGTKASEEKHDDSHSAGIASHISPPKISGENLGKAIIDSSTQIDNIMGSQPTAMSSQVCDGSQTQASVGQESNIIDLLPDEESLAGQFFGKDDLLKGNGLSWVLDFDAWISEKEGHDPKKPKVGETIAGAQEVKKSSSPQNLAFQIELELFKLFGGVNKKYKEKGRSLLFNLKDRNNPELREKVMSGIISPAHLCSMSAEELASRELSEWRIAKAEEFDQMKILPDSDIDIRRLVKKTHKGEFQVEVEEDDVSVEVSVGSSVVPRIHTDTEESKSPPGKGSDGNKKATVEDHSNSEKPVPCTITIPSNENNDLMQGFIEDELKDEEFLPPIVSLDEFMESLHSEPPFENLPTDADADASLENDTSEDPSDSKSAKLSPEERIDATSKNQEDSLDRVVNPDPDIKSCGQLQKEISSPAALSKGEPIWEGSLQLSISSTVDVTGFFKSGEKASTTEWPHTIEIKGRVRLDAFEKFLQDLNKSRSRHIMVMHLILKEQEGKDGKALGQVVDSYVADDRVGFAEPCRGMEVYLCPYHPKILDRIGKHMTKVQTGALTLNHDDKGFIGVIVWRKALVSPSPGSSSHHRHGLKKHKQEHYTSPRRHYHQDRNMNVNSSNVTHKYPIVPIVSSMPVPLKAATQEDDLPPGFGPPSSPDDDDLPEFSSWGGLSQSAQNPVQNLPADQMRHLVQRYGQNARSGSDIDDIPEWQPQVTTPPAQPTSTQQNYQPLNQSMHQHLINQQQQQQFQRQQSHVPMPLLPPMLASQENNASVWLNPQQGQFFGTQNRGF